MALHRSSGWSDRESSIDFDSASGWNDYNSMTSIPYERGAAQVVQRLFNDIDVLLFEQEANSSLSDALQTECLDWSSRFLHLRAIGKQLAPEIDNETSYQMPSESGTSVADSVSMHGRVGSPAETDFSPKMSALSSELAELGKVSSSSDPPTDLCINGSSAKISQMKPNEIPSNEEYVSVTSSDDGSVPCGIFWANFEEVFAADGVVEEYYVVDSGVHQPKHPTVAVYQPDEMMDAKKCAQDAVSTQVFEDLWEQAIPILLPAAERMLEHLAQQFRSSMSPGSSYDDLSNTQGRPLSPGMLEYLPRARRGEAMSRHHETANSDLENSKAFGHRETAEQYEVLDEPRSNAKLRGLSNAMTIRGLPLQKRQSSILGQLGSGGVGYSGRGLDADRNEWPSKDLGYEHDISRRRLGSATLGSTRVGSARVGSARMGARPRLTQTAPSRGGQLSDIPQRPPPTPDRKYATLISQVFDAPDLNLVDPRWPAKEPPRLHHDGLKGSRHPLDSDAVLPRIRASMLQLDGGFMGRPDSAARPALPSLSRRRVLSATTNGRKKLTQMPSSIPVRHKLELTPPRQAHGMREDLQILRPTTVYDSRFDSTFNRTLSSHR